MGLVSAAAQCSRLRWRQGGEWSTKNGVERSDRPHSRPVIAHHLPRRFCERALPAADFDALLVRPSRSVDDAFLATLAEVFLRVFRWERALPAALFDLLPVERLRSVLEALFAAFLPVFRDAAMVLLEGCVELASNDCASAHFMFRRWTAAQLTARPNPT